MGCSENNNNAPVCMPKTLLFFFKVSEALHLFSYTEHKHTEMNKLPLSVKANVIAPELQVY